MEYRRLGNAGVKVSELGLGCNSFGTWIDEKGVERVIHYALDRGINFFDTAPAYTDGLSEELLGKALKGRRPEVVIATKFGLKGWSSRSSTSAGEGGPVRLPASQGVNPNDQGGSRYYIMQTVDASLRRLQTDHIDLYQMHVPDPNTPIEETLRTLDDLIRMGKVRYIGCSNFEAHHLYQAMETSRRMNLESFVTAQELYNLIDRGIEKELVPCYQNYGIGLIPYRPLRMGFLTGKFKRGQGVPAGSRYDIRPESMRDGFLAAKYYNVLEKLISFAEERNHTIGELAIAWLLSHPRVSSVIAGSTKPEQIEANLKGTEWRLSPEEVAQINEIMQ